MIKRQNIFMSVIVITFLIASTITSVCLMALMIKFVLQAYGVLSR